MPRATVRLLQQEGVAAYFVRDLLGVHGDEQLRGREFFFGVEHPVVADAEITALPWKIAGAPGRVTPRLPLLATMMSGRVKRSASGELGGSVRRANVARLHAYELDLDPGAFGPVRHHGRSPASTVFLRFVSTGLVECFSSSRCG